MCQADGKRSDEATTLAKGRTVHTMGTRECNLFQTNVNQSELAWLNLCLIPTSVCAAAHGLQLLLSRSKPWRSALKIAAAVKMASVN